MYIIRSKQWTYKLVMRYYKWLVFVCITVNSYDRLSAYVKSPPSSYKTLCMFVYLNCTLTGKASNYSENDPTDVKVHWAGDDPCMATRPAAAVTLSFSLFVNIRSTTIVWCCYSRIGCYTRMCSGLPCWRATTSNWRQTWSNCRPTWRQWRPCKTTSG